MLNLLYLASILLLMLSIVYQFVNFELNLVQISDVSAKPFIYGDQLCGKLFDGSIKTDDDFFAKFVNYFGSKIVIRGFLEGKPVILKSLASKSEFIELNDLIYEYQRNGNFSLSSIKRSILQIMTDPPKENAKLHLCPAPKTVDHFLSPVLRFSEHNVTEAYLSLWTTLHLNPEPILMQLLSSPIWPVPKYEGSCGRLAVFEDCGRMLTDHYYSSWPLRASIAYQLLTAAFMFTFNHPDYAFYLKDISPDNIAVDEGGIARFIDLEHLIVVDRTPSNIGTIKTWSQNHSSENLVECAGCFSFSVEDICSYHISDHNVFGVCKEILGPNYMMPDGLLHSAPKHYGLRLQELIRECIQPNESRGRFEVADFLMQTLWDRQGP